MGVGAVDARCLSSQEARAEGDPRATCTAAAGCPATRRTALELILIIDAVINFALGVLLLLFSPKVVSWLGIPSSSTSFYPNILGAVFIGITIALLIGARKSRSASVGGLGVLGAISINLCGGLVLLLWLLFGGMQLPVRGFTLLWTLVGILIVVSLAELLHVRSARKKPGPPPGVDSAGRR